MFNVLTGGQEAEQCVNTIEDAAVVGPGDNQLKLVLEICSIEPISIQAKVAGNCKRGIGFLNFFYGPDSCACCNVSEAQELRTWKTIDAAL